MGEARSSKYGENRARTRIAVALALLALLGAAACGKGEGSSSDASSQAPDMGIGDCDSFPPDVDLVTDPGAVKVGEPMTLTARVQRLPSVQAVKVEVVVAPPGTEPAAPGPAEKPENQIAVSDPIPPGPADGQQLTLNWTPDAPGTYPVIAVVYFAGSEDCSTPPPDETDPDNAGVSESELTTLQVS